MDSVETERVEKPDRWGGRSFRGLVGIGRCRLKGDDQVGPS